MSTASETLKKMKTELMLNLERQWSLVTLTKKFQRKEGEDNLIRLKLRVNEW